MTQNIEDTTIQPNFDNENDISTDNSSKQSLKKSKNGFSIAGFILSFFAPDLGLIFSIFGLCTTKLFGSSKGFGIAGIVISSILYTLINILKAVLIVIILDSPNLEITFI